MNDVVKKTSKLCRFNLNRKPSNPSGGSTRAVIDATNKVVESNEAVGMNGTIRGLLYNHNKSIDISVLQTRDAHCSEVLGQ